jgi:hypothetical protein
LKVFRGDHEDLSFEVLTGKNRGDAQTVTKMRDLNKDGSITDADKVNGKWKTNWTAGNKSTGAGRYTINQSSPTSKKKYQNAPSWNLLNDSGIQVGTAIHGTTDYRKQFFNDGNASNNAASNGCINGKCSDLDALYDLGLPTGTPVFILPEDEGNHFELNDGVAVMRMNRENRKKYNSQYKDQTGKLQDQQGGNYTTNTLTYKPIRANFDEKKFKDERFTTLDFDDEEELNNTTYPFIHALETNKQQIMKEAQISGDVYNQIAKIAFGIYGTESEFGDTHNIIGNALRGANKKFGTDGSSPDVQRKYQGFDIPFTDVGDGAQSDNNSVGYTQIRWSQLNDKEKSVLNAFDIKSNKDLLDPAKAAIATASILGVRYNEQLTTDQKKDMWNTLPTKWNNRPNYSKRVKSNSKYLNFEQKDVMKKGGETENHIMYKNYIDGVYDGNKMEGVAGKVYDKLNRLHYKDAKAMNMSPANYVLTHIVGQR